MLIHIFSLWGAVALEAIALAVVIRLYVSERQTTPRALRQRVDELELDVSECLARVESLQGAQKRLNARLAMRQARAQEQEDRAQELAAGTFKQLRGESVADWKARCRNAIAEGRLRHGNNDQTQSTNGGE